MNSSSLLFDDLDESDDERIGRSKSNWLNLDDRAVRELSVLLLL